MKEGESVAKRPVFTISDHRPFYHEIDTEFRFFSGFAETQKQKSIESLHEAFLAMHPTEKLLEISTKSPDPTGVALSAFNLKIKLASGASFPLESVFQGSKVFSGGGPYIDLLSRFPWEAKKDPRLKESGELTAFCLEGIIYPTEPKTFFYDWLYINAVMDNGELAERLCGFSAFTDIEFNPERSINCQARSAAIFVSLCKTGKIGAALAGPERFREIVYGEPGNTTGKQLTMDGFA